MSEIMRFDLEEGASVLVEVDDEDAGIVRVSRGQDGVLEAGRRLIDALVGVRDAAGQSVQVLDSLSPDSLELEFGVKLTGEVGAVIAKTSAEGHFTVKLTWNGRKAPDVTDA